MGAGESCLADQLYYAVDSQLDDDQKHLTGKITGMLLEADNSTIQKLLHDPSLLQTAVQKAKTTITVSSDENSDLAEVNGKNDGTSKSISDEMSEVLYEKVASIYPDMASKLTGMLLEMDSNSLTAILESDSLFQTAVDRALLAITGDHEKNDVYDDNINGGCVDGLGEMLFDKVERLYPENASKITGMLLELDLDTQRQLLIDETLFEEATRKAFRAVESTNVTS